MTNRVVLADCRDVLPRMPDGCVDLIIADLPYGSTKNKWDKPIPFDFLWEQYYRVAKKNAAIILFGQNKFTAKAIAANEKHHRYNLVWKKGERTTGFLNANRMPLNNHEDLMVFYRKLPTYNPQMTEGKPVHSSGTRKKSNKTSNYGLFSDVRDKTDRSGLKFPRSILDFDKPHPPVHPTQKPVALLEYLIRMYSNPGELVLDNTMGVGTTCVAARNTGRRYFGIDITKKFYDYAVNVYEL